MLRRIVDEVFRAEQASLLTDNLERYSGVAELSESYLRNLTPDREGNFSYLVMAVVRSQFRARDFISAQTTIN